MKKILLAPIMALLLLQAACQPKPNVKQYTLNGYTLAQANAMVKDFITCNTVKPLTTNVWFSKDVLKNIVSVLDTEKAPNGCKADGMRIYYARYKGVNTVVLVSTFDSINLKTKKKIHEDFFEHNLNQPLFRAIPGIHGEATTNANRVPGARLYGVCKDCNDEDQDCDHSKPHYITMEYAQEMVWNFGRGLVNTKTEWFDKEMLDTLAKSTRLDGIRIYYARRADLDPDYPNLDGFVIATTETYKKGSITIKARDYFDCHDTQGYFIALYKRNPKMAIPLYGEDRGEQCQPNCDGTLLPQ